MISRCPRQAQDKLKTAQDRPKTAQGYQEHPITKKTKKKANNHEEAKNALGFSPTQTERRN